MADAMDAGRIAVEVGERLDRQAAPSLRAVFNLTGTVLHTNLGRAPMPQEAVAAMIAAAGACNIEYDLDKGRRGARDDHVPAGLRRLTGGNAATGWNPNAAAGLPVLPAPAT